MIRRKLGQIVYFAIDHNPAAVYTGVLRHFCGRDLGRR